ncbi:hypothetical protein BCR44DRAFT_1182406 [Catenaria anguillulae PL171]|uniref:Xylanolytic transcriptional activator regulatory domain-containing protein n=1 Tax=Catenaria anguillulae PL171 TaxID=765915 RepID=A0A1Y2HHL2_9FUNG|nr:hypothetical protein BCR44DRAFT_1182406 [Catenaria anguillulae PL171]
MGDSSGLHLFTKVSRRAAIGIDGGYIPKLYKIIDRLAVPRDFYRCLAVWPGRDHQDVLDMLVDFYYDQLHRWFPILPRSQLQEQLDGLAVYLANTPGAPRPTNDKGKPYPYPNMLLIYAFFFYTSAVFESTYKLTHRLAGGSCALPGQPKFPLSRVFSYHAKQQFSCLGENALSSIEAVQACLFLAIGDVPNVSGNPWLMCGTAVRISVELGIHHVAQLQHSYGKCSFYMPIPEQLTVYARVWCAVYAVEQMCAMALGRPSILSSEDSVLDFDLFLDTPTNRERFPGQDLLPEDSPFVWMVKLMDIGGKITRGINNIHLRKNLQHTLPELHGMLQQFQTSLPQSLQYDFSPEAPTPNIQVAFLHIMYFSCVLALYRPFLSSRRLRNDGPLQEQYLSIVETCILAIPTIYLRHREEAALFPMDASQFVVYCLAGAWPCSKSRGHRTAGARFSGCCTCARGSWSRFTIISQNSPWSCARFATNSFAWSRATRTCKWTTWSAKCLH